MSARGLADPRRRTHNAPVPQFSNAELAWPPTQEDLDAVEVVAVGPEARTLVMPPVRRVPRVPTAPRAQPAPTVHRTYPTPVASVELLLNIDNNQRHHARGVAAPARLTSFDVGRRAQPSLRPVLFAVASSVIVLAIGWPIWQVAMLPDLPVASAPPVAVEQPPAANDVRGQSPATSTAGDAEGQTVAAPPSAPLITPPVAAPPVAPAPVTSASIVSPPPASERNGVRSADAPASQVSRPTSPPRSQALVADPAPSRSPGEATPSPREELLRTTPTAYPAPAPPVQASPTEVATATLAGALPAATTDATSSRDEEAAPARTTSIPARSDEMRVQAILQRYGAAYGQLDARAAQAVWPSVDARALARAFDGLESQTLQFDRCDLDVQGLVASADCRGRTTYVRRVGSKAPRTEARAWSFRLRKVGGDWQILKAEAR